MDYLERAAELDGKALGEFARALFEKNDIAVVNNVVVVLVRRGTQREFERIAAIVEDAPTGDADGGDYYSVRYGTLDRRYPDMFISACRSSGVPESEYIKVLIAAGSADENGALRRWNAAADAYLTRRATEDYDLTADYIDRYDATFGKYGVLIKIDPKAALERLVKKVLYGKNVDKTALRGMLMDYDGLASPLMSLYMTSNACERAAIARLLLIYKNDPNVRSFLDEVAASDKSKTVREVLLKAPRAAKRKAESGGAKRRVSPVAFFENAMMTGTGYTRAEWNDILAAPEYAAVADRIFFCVHRGDHADVLVYNDGAFLNMSDMPVDFDSETVIHVLHPLDVPPDSEIFGMRISQPFEQIERKCYLPIAGEGRFSNRLNGALIARDEFDANFKRLGFIMSEKRGGELDTAVCVVGEHAVGVECDIKPDSVSCGKLYYYAGADIVKLNRKIYVAPVRQLECRALPRREYSELTRLACALFGG